MINKCFHLIGTVDNRSSFLTDYVRGQIEWDNQSAPGSGDGSLFLSKGNDSYILRSYFNNGVPSGEAILMKDNVVVSKLSLQDGKRSGICSLNDEEGYLMFRGSYVNDQKQGYGITYNKGSQILTGYYNDDQLSSILFQFNDGGWKCQVRECCSLLVTLTRGICLVLELVIFMLMVTFSLFMTTIIRGN